MEEQVNGRYTVLQTLKADGQTRVLLARDDILRQSVVLYGFSCTAGPQRLAVTERIRLHAALSDTAAMIRILDIFEDEHGVWAVAEHVRGVTMRQYQEIQQEPLTFDKAWNLLRPVADAVSVVNKKGLDFEILDLDHLLITEDHRIKIRSQLKSHQSREDADSCGNIRAVCAILYGLTMQKGMNDRQQEALKKGMLPDKNSRYREMDELIRELEAKELTESRIRRMRRAGIAAAVIAVLALAGCMFWKFTEDRKPKEQELAGNYARGSQRYLEFTTFVKDHADQTEETDEGIVYTLDEEYVLQWNRPCNQFRFSIQPETFIQKVKDCGYQLKTLEEKEKNTVEIQTYGAVITDFRSITEYQITDGVILYVAADTVSQELLAVALQRQPDSEASLAGPAGDIVCLLSEDCTWTPEEASRELEAGEQKALDLNKDDISGQYAFASRDCRVRYYWGEASQVTEYSFVPQNDFANYWWP